MKNNKKNCVKKLNRSMERKKTQMKKNKKSNLLCYLFGINRKPKQNSTMRFLKLRYLMKLLMILTTIGF